MPTATTTNTKYYYLLQLMSPKGKTLNETGAG